MSRLSGSKHDVLNMQLEMPWFHGNVENFAMDMPSITVKEVLC